MIALVCYWHGAQEHSRHVNTYALAVDQGTYMDMAALMKTSHYTVLTSRNRMPMMSALLSLFYTPNVNGDEFFARAKQLNIFISMFASARPFFFFFGFFVAVIRL